MHYLGKIFLDVRLVLAANLVALEKDGRIELEELLEQEKGSLTEASDLMKLMFKLDLKHSESLKTCDAFEKFGLDTERLFFDNLVP